MVLYGPGFLIMARIAADGPVPFTVSGVPGLPRVTGGGLSAPWQCTTVTYLPPSSSLPIVVGAKPPGRGAATAFGWAPKADRAAACSAGLAECAASGRGAAAAGMVAAVASPPGRRWRAWRPRR